MAELEKRISGDWFELREKAGDFHALLDALPLSPSQLRDSATTLRLSVEQGIIEFKRSMLSPVLVALETARYKTLDGEEMIEQEGSLTALLFAIMVQRLLAVDLLPRARPREEAQQIATDTLEVGVIVEAVKMKIKANPGLRANPAIKNILVQVQVYNKENKKMRELLPMIKPEMRASFLANFRPDFRRDCRKHPPPLRRLPAGGGCCLKEQARGVLPCGPAAEGPCASSCNTGPGDSENPFHAGACTGREVQDA